MAYTIEQLQAFSNTKPELRHVTEQIIDYLEDNPGGSSSYLVYTALLSQSASNAPVATVLQNTLGGAIVWTRDSTGNYTGTLSGAFPTNKCWAIITNGGGYVNTLNNYIDAFIFFGPGGDVDHVYVISEYNGEFSDGQISGFPIEIRVYP